MVVVVGRGRWWWVMVLAEVDGGWSWWGMVVGGWVSVLVEGLIGEGFGGQDGAG